MRLWLAFVGGLSFLNVGIALENTGDDVAIAYGVVGLLVGSWALGTLTDPDAP